ncbi:hypothetical protein ON010_g16045 [Phytophthora cinnamomi]|nr:hypothetical protein ON010_g16045 [Phytophthora cinnamomi]
MVTNHGAKSLDLTSALVADANHLKQAIYALMGLTGCSGDLVHAPHPGAGTTCALAGQEHHWANPHVLRTYAPHLRQPILVIDVDSSGTGRFQIYSYQDHELHREGDPDVTTHETGNYTSLDDATASEYFLTCGRLHVLPTFMLLKHHECHFYGVQYGEPFLRWHSEGDPDFAATVGGSYCWRESCLTTPSNVEVRFNTAVSRFCVGFDVLLNGKNLNLRDDSDETNDLLISGLTMLQRLDVAHVRIGWPVIDQTHYGVEEMEVLMHEAERQIYKAAGLGEYAMGAEPSTHAHHQRPPQPHGSRGRMHTTAYEVLLDSPSPTDLASSAEMKTFKSR